MAGAILNINIRLNPATISVILHHSESKLVFVYHKLCSLVLDASSLLPSNHPRPRLVLISDEDNNTPTPREFCASYEDLIARGDATFEWISPLSEWDPIVLNYTSGTTSSPKGVVHCHRGSYISSLDSLMDWSVPKNQSTYGPYRCSMSMDGPSLGGWRL
uniref:AMP-dependent synthetase/ligase domain-containing protein n=1 Tax=Chenopodium quinoa TaxID=63459 RepID=A0A803LRG4_CHEQI